jgi:drug/metabolite transporter (DMT)-like permease
MFNFNLMFRGSTRTTPNAAILIMTVAAAFWGMGTVFSKAILDTIPPITLLCVELFASASVLWALVFVTGSHRGLNLRTLWSGWPGLLEPGLAYIFLITGLSMTSASNASLLGIIEPAIVVILAWVLLGERLSRSAMRLVMLVVAGTVMISASSLAGGGGGSLVGDLLILCGVVCTSMYAIATRASVSEGRASPLVLAALQQTFGLVCGFVALPVALIAGEGSVLAAVPTSSWAGAIVSGVFQCAFAVLLYLSAIKTLSATHSALILTSIPIFGVFGAAVLLGESLTLLQLAGSGVIIGALLRLKLAHHDVETVPNVVVVPQTSQTHSVSA